MTAVEEANDVILAAARVLIHVTGMDERASKAELTLGVEVVGGKMETWLITIERIASGTKQ